MANEINASSKSAQSETRDKWIEMLQHVSLDQLNHVRTFSYGNFSYVSLVQLDGQPDSAFALKTMEKARIKSQSARKRVMLEKEILSKVQSDFIVRLFRTFKTNKYLYFLTEYCPGGDLFYQGRFTEAAAKFYIACVVEALDCLHSKNISHNDIKPENLVVDAEGYVKVIDLGFAEELERGELSPSLEGTPEFLPPEVVWSGFNEDATPKGRDRAADLWALGVVLYEFLKGESPFEDKDRDREKTSRNIMRGIYSINFSKRYFAPEAADLIRRLCAYKHTKRLGYENIEEIRTHRWFKNFNWTSLRNRELQPPMVPEIATVVDTQNFKHNVAVRSDSDVEEDESDWDMDF